MKKRLLTLTMTMALLLSIYASVLSAQAITLHRADYLVFAATGGPESVDGAYAYDTASFGLIFNVYDTMLWFDNDRSKIPQEGGLLDKFVPSLATSWVIEDISEYDAVADETWLQKFTFTMRDGVTWHDNTVSSAADMARHAEYSYERWILQDRAGGNVWLMLSFTLGYSSVWHPGDPAGHTEADAELFAHKIDQAIQRSGDTVIIRRNTRWLPVVFLQTIAQGWASIYNKEWCVALGDWPGWEVTGYTWTGWQAWHDPTIPPIDAAGHPMMGTGPYKLDWLTMGVEWSIVAHEDYWGGWPSPISHGYFHRATLKVIKEWSVRKAGFLAGDYDSVYVPNPNIPELVVYKDPETGEETYPEGIRCYRELPVLRERNVFYNFEVQTPSAFLLPKYYGLPHGTFDESGTPPDFFSDLDLRKAFAYCFNYSGYINEVFHGEAIQPATYHAKGLAYYNPPPPEGTGPEPFTLDLDKAEEHFKKAWGGSVAKPGPVWTNGFNFNLVYLCGVNEYEAAANMLKTVVEAINPKFHINVMCYQPGLEPPFFPFWDFVLFVVGWMAYYADPDNLAHPYMHSDGWIAWGQSYSDPTLYTVGPLEDGWSFVGTSDEIIDAARDELNLTRREAMYHKLQEIFHDRVINMPIAQLTERHWEREWIKGWYHSVISPRFPKIYHLWRRMAADLDYDGVVNIVDKWILHANWGPFWQPEVDEYYRADINMDGFVNIKDKFYMYERWGDVDPYQH